MFIRDLSKLTGVSAKTIRYYETVDLMPQPKRDENNFRQYSSDDVERLRFITSARSLGFPIKDISEFLLARDEGIAPCDEVLDKLAEKLDEVDRRIADMLALRETLIEIHREGVKLPRNDVKGENCVCYLIKTYRESGKVIIEQENISND